MYGESYVFGIPRRPLIGTVAVVAIGLAIGIPAYNNYSSTKQATVTICGKEAVPTGESGHEYRVYTSGGTFKVVDHIVNGARFTSADTYGNIQQGKVYTLNYYGWRIPITSEFPNIEKATVDPKGTPAACD